MLLSEHIVHSIYNNKPIGKIFIFKFRPFIGKNYNDPEKNNFEIVYCTNKGELIFHKTTKLTTAEGDHMHFHGAFGDENNVYLHFNSFEEKQEQYFGIIRFDHIGNETIYKYPKTLLKANIINITGNSNQKFDLNRKALGLTNQTPGCNWGLDNNLTIIGVQKIDNVLYIWGQMNYAIDDPDYKPPTTPDGNPISVGLKPKITLFGEVIFFKYDFENLAFEKAFLQNMPILKEKSSIKLIKTNNIKATFYAPMPSAKIPEHFHLIRSLHNNGAIIEDYPYKYFYSPLIIEIEGSTAKNNFIDTIFLLDKYKSIVQFKDNAGPVIVGFTINNENSHVFKLHLID